MPQEIRSLRFLFLYTVFLLAQSGSSTFNITRYTKGDVFQNTNSSESCIDTCVLNDENSQFCAVNCCSCVCPSHSPTYLLKNGNCSSEDRLMAILKAQSGIQDCDHRMVVSESHFPCGKEVITTLDSLSSPGNRSLHLCSWNKNIGDSLIHYRYLKNLNNCEIVPEESLYLINGSWKSRSSQDPFLAKLNVKIVQDPVFDNDKLYLKWNSDIGKQYDGLIFSLKLLCRSKQGKDLKSCVHFKKSGSFTDIKPTSKPSLLKSTRLPATSVVQTTAEKTKTTAETTIKATAETTVTSRENLTSTAHAPTSLVFGVVRNTPFDDPPKNNPNSIVLIILASLAGALFGLLACSTLVFLIWRRNRNFQVKKELNKATNPLYERGASGTLKLTHIQNGNGQTEEVWPDYQPLVENTKPRERADSLPGYRTLSIGQKPNQHLTSDRGARSSNYLSLLKDDPEEERMYQTLIIKDANSQKLEIIDEAKIPDYAELEERSDSEDSFDSDDSKDYEEPPPPLESFVERKPCLPAKGKLNNLSSACHDYDEPEGIIVIPDNENDSPEQVVSCGNDFHDYADPDDTDEDNVTCHVTPQEDLSCYHDYDDPAE
ncbi:hypothetical protein ABFA07_019352 [Porites harrisoni]